MVFQTKRYTTLFSAKTLEIMTEPGRNEQVNEIKYLGVQLLQLNFNRHIDWIYI